MNARQPISGCVRDFFTFEYRCFLCGVKMHPTFMAGMWGAMSVHMKKHIAEGSVAFTSWGMLTEIGESTVKFPEAPYSNPPAGIRRDRPAKNSHAVCGPGGRKLATQNES